MPRRYAMAIDLRLCMGCAGCVAACMSENESFGYSRCRVVEEVHGSWPQPSMLAFSERCNHCAEPACVPVCPTGASRRGPDGLILIDQSICTGCKACFAACPYNSRFLNREGAAAKCDFCESRAARGDEPFCVSQCPTEAMVFGDLNDPQSRIRKLLETRRSRVRKAEAGLRPHVFYLEARQ